MGRQLPLLSAPSYITDLESRDQMCCAVYNCRVSAIQIELEVAAGVEDLACQSSLQRGSEQVNSMSQWCIRTLLRNGLLMTL